MERQRLTGIGEWNVNEALGYTLPLVFGIPPKFMVRYEYIPGSASGSVLVNLYTYVAINSTYVQNPSDVIN